MADKYKYDWSGKVGDYLVKAPVRGAVFNGAQAVNWIAGRLGLPEEVENNNARDIQKWADVLFPYRTNDGEGNFATSATEFVGSLAGGRLGVGIAAAGLKGLGSVGKIGVKAAVRKVPRKYRPPPIVRPGKVTTDAARKATVEAHGAYQRAIGTAGEQAAKDAWRAADAAESTALSATSFMKKAKAGYDWTVNHAKPIGPWLSRPATKIGEKIAESSPVVLGAPYSTALAFLGDNLIPGAIAQRGKYNAGRAEEKAMAEANARADEAMKNSPAYRLRDITKNLSKDSDIARVSDVVSQYRDFRKGVAADKTAEYDREFLKAARVSPAFGEYATNHVNRIANAAFIKRYNGFYEARMKEWLAAGYTEDQIRSEDGIGLPINAELVERFLVTGKDDNKARLDDYNKQREKYFGTAEKPIDPGLTLISGGK